MDDDSLISTECEINLAKLLSSDMNDMNPYSSCLLLCCTFSMLCFVISSITGNVSQTDKLWSITPVIYAWVCVSDTRTLLMAILVTVWGVRLTYNFNRRGGYTFPKFWEGEEDYRWEILKSGTLPGFGLLTKPFVWVVFNLTFISFYQHILLLLIVSPSLVAFSAVKMSNKCADVLMQTDGLNNFDYIATFLMLTFILLESVADKQQYVFQTEKYRKKRELENLSGDFAAGFCRSGLFSIVRKPNYACEQMIWVSYYFFSVAAFPRYLVNWSICGCLLLILLFQGSGWMTELHSSKKYPDYSEYQRRVPLFFPTIVPYFREKTKLS